ncbi:MAG: homocysteine S-methyltransferase family protein, partial [Saprospiraceae bacterium]|nr:homocysteine S-methyltransferase family protein [Saprospiraceae bacterium]
MKKDTLQQLTAAARERILIIDGSMGVFLQSYNLPEIDFRGERFMEHFRELKGNYDVLCLTRPDIIQDIHQKYLEAGADIIETNTFNATSISQADFEMPPGVCYDINKAAAEIAQKAIREWQTLNPQPSTQNPPKFVA